jgi:NAD-dependent dihydropyrimidine dehydrogenase PreA subunit
VPYVIAEPCIDTKERSCIDVCPVDCIYETDRMLVIDPDECIDCGACVPECPVDAIYSLDTLPDKWSGFEQINAAWQEGADRVTELVNAEKAQAGVAFGSGAADAFPAK